MEDGSQELQTVVDDSEVRVAINGPATREVEFMVHQEEPTRFDGINPETLAKLKKLELKSENLVRLFYCLVRIPAYNYFIATEN